MNRKNNYELQATQAIQTFLKMNQEELIEKHKLSYDKTFLYTSLFSIPFRIHRENGEFQRLEGETWCDDRQFSSVMTILDLLCESAPDRHPAGKMQSMAGFGHLFHTNLLENPENPTANWIASHPEEFQNNCLALGGTPWGKGDIGFEIPIFQDLKMAISFWEADEDFPASITWFWDQNALQYLHYETMYYAVDFLSELITKEGLQ